MVLPPYQTMSTMESLDAINLEQTDVRTEEGCLFANLKQLWKIPESDNNLL